MKRIAFVPSCLGAFVVLGMAGLAGLSLSAVAESPSVALKPDLTIGVEEGDENLMFGAIVRIDLDGRGNIYVLDYKYRKISMFGPEGTFLRAVTVPAGQGPQEATNLSGIAVTPGGTLFVNDMRKVIVYGADGSYLRTFLVDFMISSVGCPGTEDLVAIGPRAGKILHVLDASGKLLDSFGDLFPVLAELEPMKEMPMFGAPLLFNCAKDGRIFVLNPHKYEVSIFKDRRLEQVLKGESELFKPLERRGRGFVSTSAHIVSSGEFVFVSFDNPDPRAPKTMDIFKAGKQVGRLDVAGKPHIVDRQRRIYFAEDEGFPKVRRYSVVEN